MIRSHDVPGTGLGTDLGLAHLPFPAMTPQEGVAEAVWQRFLARAACAEQLEAVWICCLRQAYPELGIPDLAGRFLDPWRELVAGRVPLARLPGALSFPPVDLPGWQALSAVVLQGLGNLERERLDRFVIAFSARLADIARSRIAPKSLASALGSASKPAPGARGSLPERWTESHGLVGSSPTASDLVRTATRAARDRYPVLIVGESGVGKEVVARLIHELSESRGPFVAVNCAAIPEALVESELFGHVRGAFSGAHEKREGLFAEARGGTLLLDEVTEIPLHEQAKILRVIQDGLVRPVGSSHYEKVDFRVIATSNRDLEQALASGHLRRDLYYRLAVHEIVVPPLREHASDIPELVAAFLDRWRRGSRGRPPPTLSSEAMAALVTYPWPGNVRELEHAVFRLASRHSGRQVEVEHIENVAGNRAEHTPPPPAKTEPPERGSASLSDVERDTVARALVLTNGNKSAAARRLGITRKTLYRKIRRYGIELS